MSADLDLLVLLIWFALESVGDVIIWCLGASIWCSVYYGGPSWGGM
jgi:hypothetical protein